MSRHDNNYAVCNLCNKHLKYSQNGFQTIFAHSEKMKHKTMSNAKYNTNQVHIVSSKPTSSKSTSESSGSSTPSTFQLDPTMDVKVRAAEAKWLFKLAEEDYSFRSCDDLLL